MSHFSARIRAFSLVEILIVVVILAILAALVVPKFTNASHEASSKNVLSQLQVVRIQLEMYRTQHNGGYPLLEQLWDNLLQRTNIQGAIDPAGDLGPYLKRAPKNQFTGSSTVVTPGSETKSDGWTYDELTGAFHAVGFDEQTQTFTAP